MLTKLIDQTSNKVTIQFTVEFTGQMLEDEEALQQSLNEAGQAAMIPMIKRYDTKGAPIFVNGVKHTVKNYAPHTYETPYGPVKVERHTYQTSKGGRHFIPMEDDARMVLKSTPRYAQMVSGKYARFGADAICEDLLECNGRSLSRNYAKKLSDFVGSIAQCYETEWEYNLPEFEQPVKSIGIGLDGTCMLMKESGWREAMCGTISFYDKEGERLHTIYCGAAPQYGKEKFGAKLSREIELVQEQYPDVLYVGVADGAKDNWPFLKRYTSKQILDFYHAREYISKAASAIFGRNEKAKVAWVEDWSHQLRHKYAATGRLIKEIESRRANLDKRNFIQRDEELRNVIGYYKNNKQRMNYPIYTKQHLPIGSGVTEAACKTLVKQRMCISGSRWKDDGASCVLQLRALKLTKDRWKQFWNKILANGFTTL